MSKTFVQFSKLQSPNPWWENRHYVHYQVRLSYSKTRRVCQWWTFWNQGSWSLSLDGRSWFRGDQKLCQGTKRDQPTFHQGLSGPWENHQRLNEIERLSKVFNPVKTGWQIFHQYELWTSKPKVQYYSLLHYNCLSSASWPPHISVFRFGTPLNADFGF